MTSTRRGGTTQPAVPNLEGGLVRFVGIDPGLLITGYACLEHDLDADRSSIIEAGVIRLPAGRSVAHRLVRLDADLRELLEERRPRVVAVEKLFAHYRHARTSILMAHARGVVLLAAERLGAAIVEVTATEVKKAITGNGHASKDQMQRAVMSQCGLRELPSPPDVADAIGIAMCAARRAGTARVVGG